MNKNVILLLGLTLSLFACKNAGSEANSSSQEAYEWKNVQIVGGGFCDGIVFHPKYKDIRYARTDMGGAYRWDAELEEWIPMLDFISYEDNNLVGVESIAVDPKSKKRLYLACGTYTRAGNGAILISDDGGRSFTINRVPFAMGGNENGRGNGERMMVDPNNSDIIYMGTRKDGLWRSEDAGQNWQQVSSFMEVLNATPNSSLLGSMGFNASAGTVFVLFDKSSKSRGRSQSIYVGYSRMNEDNLYVSHDGGTTWAAVEGAPKAYMPNHAVISSDRKLYVSYGTSPGPSQMTNGALWMYDLKEGTWSNITPDSPSTDRKFGYAAVSVDAKNPKHLIVSSFGRPATNGVSEELFRSTDGGKTWKGVFSEGGQYDESKAPYVINTGIHWLFDIEIDPFNPDHAMFTTGYGGWETYNLSNLDKGVPSLWTVMSKGIEETVPLELYSPNKGAWLISGIGDYGGFTHHDLDRPASDSHHDPRYGNTNGVTGAPLRPELVLRVGTIHGGYSGKTLSYSLDGGDSWLEPESVPVANGRNGHIACSADGTTWVWTPDRNLPYYSDDMGSTWNQCKGIDASLRVVADQVNPMLFYAIDIRKGLIYKSVDGAKSFEASPLGFSAGPGPRGDNRGGQDRIYATPGYENELWIAAFDGLYHAAKGESFLQKDFVSEMHAFGFGAPAPGSNYPALYMVGVVEGVRGFFRSDDAASSWVRINDDEHQYGLVLHITGDPKKYGRVYLGTHGRGALYGDPKIK